MAAPEDVENPASLERAKDSFDRPCGKADIIGRTNRAGGQADLEGLSEPPILDPAATQQDLLHRVSRKDMRLEALPPPPLSRRTTPSIRTLPGPASKATMS